LASQKKWRDANREYDTARKKAYRSANAEIIRARENAKRAANREARRAKDQANRERNRERHRAVKREWSRKNRDKVANKARQRRARHAGAEGRHTPADLARIRNMQNDRCAYCRIELSGAGFVDHIVALVNGGSNWPSNLQLVCRPCNSSKGALDAIEFARRTGRLL
jgi:5-methylcytosine-specific restriction endonuclease McrA